MQLFERDDRGIWQYITDKSLTQNFTFEDDRAWLIAASEKGNNEIVQTILERNLGKPDDYCPIPGDKNSFINSTNNKKQTALFKACQFNHPEVVNSLLKYNPEVNWLTDAKESPVLIAANKGCTEIVKTLLKLGPDLD